MFPVNTIWYMGLMEVHTSWILRLLQTYFPTPSTLLQKEGRIRNLNLRLTLHGIIIICDKDSLQTANGRVGVSFLSTSLFLRDEVYKQSLVLREGSLPQNSSSISVQSWLHPLFVRLLPSWTLAGFPSLKSSAAFLVNCSTYQPASWSLGAYWISDENTAELDKQLFSL